MIIRRRKCIVFAFVSLSRIRGQGACVLIKETATGDILSAVIVSVCHRAESDMWTIHHRRKLHFFSLSQVSAIRGEWRKMTARWSLSTIYHKAIEADHCMLSRQTLLLLLLLVCFIESCQASLIKLVWLCGLCQKLLLQATVDHDFKKASAQVENFRYLIDFNTTELRFRHLFFSLSFVFIALLLL